jgi:hypothetical protein
VGEVKAPGADERVLVIPRTLDAERQPQLGADVEELAELALRALQIQRAVDGQVFQLQLLGGLGAQVVGVPLPLGAGSRPVRQEQLALLDVGLAGVAAAARETTRGTSSGSSAAQASAWGPPPDSPITPSWSISR